MTSGLTIGTVTVATDVADPADHAVVTVPVTNTGTADVRAHVALTLPAGWRRVPVVRRAGRRPVAQVEVKVPVVVPLDRASTEPVPVDVVVRRAGATLAQRSVDLTLDAPRPPASPRSTTSTSATPPRRTRTPCRSPRAAAPTPRPA